ncbi:MAG: alanine racemase, partial [Chloroflexi bacterium]|nr:alanine racemase [Chloroflexota bacterium]
MNLFQQITDNYHRVNDRLVKAAHFAGRNLDEIKLIVVTKARPIEVVRAVIASGARYIGENYPAEGAAKIAMVANESIEWHMIGHIQSRKAKIVCKNYAWVHSIDRIKIANRIDQRANEYNRMMPVLLECNVSGEISKHGWPAWDENKWSELVDTLGPLLDLDWIQV